MTPRKARRGCSGHALPFIVAAGSRCPGSSVHSFVDFMRALASLPACQPASLQPFCTAAAAAAAANAQQSQRDKSSHGNRWSMIGELLSGWRPAVLPACLASRFALSVCWPPPRSSQLFWHYISVTTTHGLGQKIVSVLVWVCTDMRQVRTRYACL